MGSGAGGGGTGLRTVASGAFTTTTTFAGGAGGDAGPALNGGGGGGGAGGYGIRTGETSIDLTAALGAGSIRGGNGGAGGTGFNGEGGGGGDGGVGVFIPQAGSRLTLTSGTISGGNGRIGGFSFTQTNGASGAGGAGVLGSGLSITNAGTIQGGNGAAFQPNDGTAGVGGIGIVGSSLRINNTGGTISGGMSGAVMAVQAYAIQLTGGANYIGGAGTINGGINVTGGSFQPALPGSPVGTPLNVTGPISFAPGTFYNVRITPTANDSLVATGQATLTGATVSVLAGNGTYTVGTRQIFSAATRGGTFFAGVTSNLAFLMPTLTYVGDGLVFLNLQAGTTDSNPGGIDYRTAALTQNQLAVAGGLTNAGNHNGDSGPVLTALNQLTVPQARAAFDSLSGEGITATQNLAYRSAQLFNAAIFDQTTFYGPGTAGNAITLTDAPSGFLAYAPSVDTPRAPIHELADLPSSTRQAAMPSIAPNRTWRAWATGFGGVEDIHGTAVPGSATQNNTIYGGVLGVDYQLMPNYLVGVAVGGSNGDFSVPGRTTSGTTTGGHIAIYDIATFGRFYGASSTSFSYFSNRTNRFVSGFGGLVSENERGTFASNEFRSRLEFGRHFDGYGATVTPFVALELAELRSNGFNEQATSGPGNFVLNVSGQSTASVPGYVGARFQRITPIGNGMILSPTLEVAYVHEFSPYRSQIATLVDLPGSTFLVDGARPSRDAAHVKAGGELAFGPRSFLFANFDGEFSGVDQFYGGKGGFRYVW